MDNFDLPLMAFGGKLGMIRIWAEVVGKLLLIYACQWMPHLEDALSFYPEIFTVLYMYVQ